MFGKCIKIIDNIVQWTKKWHFFHIIFVAPFIILCIILIQDGIISIKNYINPLEIDVIKYNNTDLLKDFDNGPALEAYYIIYLFFSIIVTYIAPFLQFIIFIIRWITRKAIHIKSKFLLNNKFYNFLYYFSSILFIVVYTYFCITYFHQYS